MKHFYNETTGETVGEGFAGLNDRDWREVTMAEIAAIQAAKEEEMPKLVPQTVSRFQARAALHVAGLLAQIEALIANADPLAQMAWQDATEFHRDSPTLQTLAGHLGMTDAQLDDLFRAAAQIKA